MKMPGFRSWGVPSLILLILLLAGMGFDPFGLPENSVLAVLSITGFLGVGYAAYRSDPNQSSSVSKKSQRRFFIGSALILSLLSLYVLNPSHGWEAGLGARPVDHVAFLPASAFPTGTLHTLLFVATALAVLGLSMNLGRKESRGLRWVIVSAAVVTALAVLGQRVEPRLFQVVETTGFFMYENHFAAFANLILPVALFSAASQQIKAFQAGRISSPAGLLYCFSGLLVAAVIFSRSRAGFVVSGLILGAFVFWIIRLRRNNPLIAPPVSRLTKAGAGMGAVAVLGVFVWILLREWSGIRRVGEELAFRSRIVLDTLKMWLENPGWGTGPGSFAAVFPYYQTVSPEKYFLSHAHCEPIEFLAEYGIVGGGLLLATVFWILFPRGAISAFPPFRLSAFQRFSVSTFQCFSLSAFQRFRLSAFSPPFQHVSLGLWVALIGLGLHSLVDFPLRHPLNALLAVLWVGILAGQYSNDREAGETESSR